MIQVFQPWEMDNFRGLRIDRYSSRIDIWASREDTRKLFRNIEVISSLLACHICENCLSLGLARCVDISFAGSVSVISRNLIRLRGSTPDGAPEMP
jgi:hypothetical protein